MTTGAPSICRKCGEPLVEENDVRACINGCQIYSAQPVGSEYMTSSERKPAADGRLWESGGAVGCLRRVPTCRD